MLCGVRQLPLQGSRRAHVAKHNDCSGHLPVTIVDGCHRIFDINLASVAPDKKAVQRKGSCLILGSCFCHRIQDDFSSNRVHDPNAIGHSPSDSIVELPAGHRLRNAIHEGDVALSVSANHRIANTVESDLCAFLLNKLDFFEGFTFDRIEESSLQCAKLNLPFNEIVLCTLLNRLKSDWLVDRVA